MQDSRRYQTASEVLDSIRAQLREKSSDDMTLLLKIFAGLKSLDTNRMSPRDAARWLIQEQTKKEARFEEFVTQMGFNKGFWQGFLFGFAICACLGLAMRYS